MTFVVHNTFVLVAGTGTRHHHHHNIWMMIWSAFSRSNEMKHANLQLCSILKNYSLCLQYSSICHSFPSSYHTVLLSISACATVGAFQETFLSTFQQAIKMLYVYYFLLAVQFWMIAGQSGASYSTGFY